MKPQNNKKDRKAASTAADGSLGLAIGLSLGVLFGIAMDNLGLGMMLGVAAGLCGASAAGALRKNKKSEGQTDDDEKQ